MEILKSMHARSCPLNLMMLRDAERGANPHRRTNLLCVDSEKLLPCEAEEEQRRGGSLSRG